VRPLLQGDDPRGRISQLLEERREGYGQFTQVATGGRSAEEVAEEILRLMDMATRRRQPAPEA
jgi:shikimate kinase